MSEGSEWSCLNSSRSRASSANRRDVERAINQMTLENRIRYINEGTVVLDGKYTYYCQKGLARVKGDKTLHDVGDFKDFVRKYSERPIILRTCTFGRHKGLAWKDVPPGYMEWCLNQPDFDREVHDTCRYYLGYCGLL
jgi:hypothetical protein